ncbi:MAG: SRPBCC family protein [Oligoflexales bacterium]|nr:SRPBCC family protein [Oligoflexales bacterium]
MFSLPFSLSRSTKIDLPIQDVFKMVGDFATWKAWSPWLCQEPECPVQISGSPLERGHKQKWDGKRIGAGEMFLVDLKADQLLTYELNFTKPWKSKSDVSFEFIAEGASTILTWKMKGTVPIFLFFLRKMMASFVGADYERGLSMLKEFLETGKVLSETKFRGVVSRDGFHYYGIHRNCQLTQIGPAMEEDFTKLHKLIEAKKIPDPEFVCSIYHKFDMVGGRCEYTCGFAYQNPIETDSQDNIDHGRVEAHHAIQVDHKGSYKHLGNAWVTAYSCQRSDRKKILKGIHPYEIYLNEPGKVPDAELETQVFGVWSETKFMPL